ncbi:RICIN domain-containing protein [Chamaesiphon sp. VAR_69_metabat_338]|uniref:RICIN domain-containing protein n=1 Tax=Chamaesiphon sp. VAR_69_metabat_338 TaxID=2964704 RepID=UPI00286DCCD6|nr:RICIN domain-containing protein [Chamaesiphon sp. VAR_69_metabat_338]
MMQFKKLAIVIPLVLVSLLAQEVNAQVKQNRLRNTLTGSSYCLDIINDGDNNKLTMARCANVSGQRWSLTASETNPQAYRLQTPFTGTGNCLATIDDGNNNRLTIAKCSNAPGQLWSITPSNANPGSSGYSNLRNELTGADKCLKIINDGRNNKLTMATCSNVAGQSWRITKTP